MHYDRDQSGALDLIEVTELLGATGLKGLSESEVLLVLGEYDADEDGLLCPMEGVALMRDVWRMVVASR